MELQFARQVVPCVWPGGGMRRAHPAERVELWLNTQLGRGTRRLRRYTRAFRRCPLAPAHTRAASGSRHHALHAYLYNLSANVTLLDTHLFAHWHCGGGDSCAAPAATGSALLAPVLGHQCQYCSGSCAVAVTRSLRLWRGLASRLVRVQPAQSKKCVPAYASPASQDHCI